MIILTFKEFWEQVKTSSGRSTHACRTILLGFKQLARRLHTPEHHCALGGSTCGKGLHRTRLEFAAFVCVGGVPRGLRAMRLEICVGELS
jgi:hypothetical protein